MQKCPFCEFDRGETPTYEGRCPNCGNVVEWPEGELTSSVEDPATRDTLLYHLPEAGTMAPDTAQDSVLNGEMPIGGGEPSEQLPRREVDSGEGPLAKTEPDVLNQMWRDSITGEATLGSTLKGPADAVTVSDSVFSIQHREIRAADTELGAGVDYELLNIIGQGGVGVVYAARQSSIDRKVAIKMLREQYGQRSDHRDKFLAEAVVTGELDHPNIVPIYDLGRSVSGELFYSMKNVVGTAWDRVIRQKPLRENIDILMKVADAVAFAHSRGVVHRDLKPENIMLGDFGEVLVMDWGIALPTEDFSKSSSILRSQAMGGTPAYMAPEMATGPIDQIGPAADVYLLGAILFEILTGMPPHDGKDVMECIQNASRNVIQPTEARGELFEISRKAMATVPRRRYRSVLDFQAAIRLYQAHIESITLSDNAEQDLQTAIAEQDYQELSRTVFAFREALALWGENTSAADGLLRAQLAYASTALEKGDYDLGLSLLEEDRLEHQPLVGQLKAARQEREARQSRLRAIRKLAVALMGFIILSGAGVLLVILQLFSQAKLLNSELGVAQQGLEQEIAKVRRASQEAESQRQRAEKKTAEALAQSTLAESRRQDAELARLDSVAQKIRAEESSYFAEIGLVTASIEQNGFAVAADLLQRQLESPTKSKLRHWEWGRNRYLVQGGTTRDSAMPVVTHSTKEAVASLDRSADGSWIAVGLTSGECSLWRAGEQQPRFQFQHGRSLNSLDLDDSGNFLVTGGTEVEQGGSLKVWRIATTSPPTLQRTIIVRSAPQTVAFSNDPQASYIVSGDRERAARIWKWREEAAPQILLGHLDAISSAGFSPDNQYVATASLDGSVRLWRRESAVEVQRFSGHAAPVLAVAFAPQGNLLASAGADKRILLWKMDPNRSEAADIEEIRQRLTGGQIETPAFEVLAGHSAPIRDLDFSANGQWLASAGNDNTVCVWNLAPAGTQEEMQLSSAQQQLTSASRLSARLRGHGGWVGACRLNAEGTELISGADDRTWKSWRWRDYREQLVVGNGVDAILDAHFAPDGHTFATALNDGRIVIWDAATGDEIATLREGHEYLTNHAKFVSAGRHLVTAAGDNTLRLWDVERGTQFAVLEHAGRNALFSVSPDSRWLVASGDETGLCVWDLTNPQQPPARLRSWAGQEPTSNGRGTFVEPTSVAISADGKLVCVGDRNGACEFWDVGQGQLIRRIVGHAEAVVATFFVAAPAGEKFVEAALSVSTDGTAAWWDPLTGQELPRERLRHFAPLQRAALAHDRQWLACGAVVSSGNSRLWLWHLPTGELRASGELAGELIQEIAFSEHQPTSLFVTSSGFDDSRKSIWNWNAMLDQWQPIGAAAMRSGSLWGAIPNTDASQLLTFGGRGARLWQLAHARELMSYRPSAAVGTIAFSPDGSRLAAGASDGTIEIWDLKNFASERKLVGGHERAVLDVSFAPEGERLLSTAEDGRLVVWDVANGNLRNQQQIAEPLVCGNAIAFFSEGRSIVLAGDDHKLRIYNAEDLQLQRTLEGHTAAVTCVDVSPDGRWLVSGSEDKSLRVWSVDSGLPRAILVGHSAAVQTVAFSSDNLRIVSSSQDSTAKLWDVSLIVGANPSQAVHIGTSGIAEMAELLSLNFHQQPAVSAEFSPDGHSILTASRDGHAVIWPAESVGPAVRLAPGISYVLGSPPIRLDSTAIVCQPGSFDLQNGKLLVWLEPVKDVEDSIAVDCSDGAFSITGQSLSFHPSPSQSVEVGTFRCLSDHRIEIDLGAQAEQSVMQQLVRHISYQGVQRGDAMTSTERTIALSLLDGAERSPNAPPESVVIHLRPAATP